MLIVFCHDFAGTNKKTKKRKNNPCALLCSHLLSPVVVFFVRLKVNQTRLVKMTEKQVSICSKLTLNIVAFTLVC